MEQNIQKDQEITLIQKNIPILTKKAEAVIVKDELTSKTANDIALTLKKMIRQLEDKRKYYVNPLNETIKRINNSFKEKTEPLTKALNIIRDKIQAYMIEQRRKQERERIGKQTKDAEFLGEQPKPEKQPPAPTQVTSSFGKSFIQKRWTWKLVDIEKVPREYLSLDEKKINAMIRAKTQVVKGISNCDLKINGIEIYQKDSMGMKG